ncbi:MAG: hypothetical protein NTY64_16460 [Deltaproteobacteria bacterium]|nr:hypothetical protein [Deltaproteobacteria bacterium]
MKMHVKNPQNIQKKKFIQNMLLVVGSILIFCGLGETITRLSIGNPLLMESDEILFWKYKRDQIGHQKLYSPISRVDKNGFRYSGKEFDPKFPVVYLGGDSYAWGEGVLDADTVAAQLQRLLGSNNLQYCVLNGGVPGYGIAFLKLLKEQIFEKLLHTDLGLGYQGDESITYGKTYPFEEKVQGLTPRIKENVQFLKDRNIIPVWVFMTVPSGKFRNYLSSLSKELSVELIDPEAEYRKCFPGLKNMSTEHSGHFRPEVYAILANEIFKNIFQKKLERG